MPQALICDAIRTPFGRYGGALSAVRPDDLAAIPLKALVARNRNVDWGAVGDVVLGCANQAGEDNRNVARMALLLAGLPQEVSGTTINRLCGSGLDCVGTAARAIRSGEAELMVAGGVESMSRAPFVMPKADAAFARNNAVYDTTIGWRFVNALMKQQYGVDSMPETAENVAAEFGIDRDAQDRMALRSQVNALRAQRNGFFAREITPVTIAQKKGEPVEVAQDEHPRETSLEALAKLKGVVRPDGTVTAGNSSGVNDGACAAARQRAGSDTAWADAASEGRGYGHDRCRPADHGHRAGARHAQSARAGRAEAETDRRDRAQRGIRCSRAGRSSQTGSGRRRRAREPERRRNRARAPAGRKRSAPGDDRRQSAAA